MSETVTFNGDVTVPVDAFLEAAERFDDEGDIVLEAHSYHPVMIVGDSCDDREVYVTNYVEQETMRYPRDLDMLVDQARDAREESFEDYLRDNLEFAERQHPTIVTDEDEMRSNDDAELQDCSGITGYELEEVWELGGVKVSAISFSGEYVSLRDARDE